MRDRELYARILGLTAPWRVSEVDLDPACESIEVHVTAASSVRLRGPECGKRCGRHDHRTRRWRHLDTCQYRTTIVAEVPRVRCEDHGVLQVAVPWAEPGSRFTALFEAVAIDWLTEASINAVARRLRLTWHQADGIMQRAVERGLARREPVALRRLGIDETSFQKRHEYVTVVSDQDTDCVLYVADHRKTGSLQPFFDELSPEELETIDCVSMDMWKPFISVVEANLPEAKTKICFDKFHVAQYLGDAVSKVRSQEHRKLMEQDDRTLVGSKFVWLQNPQNMGTKMAGFLERLKGLALRTARAWALKENAMCLWHYISRTWARKAWKTWLSWAMRSRLEPIKRVARMIRNHLEGILNAIVLGATNAGAESINSRIQRVKRMGCGFRNRQRFRNAIYFHLGGLDLMPVTHTKP